MTKASKRAIVRVREASARSRSIAAASLVRDTGFRASGAKIDAADTAWMISATGLVLMMTIPGLALFYAGMVRKKNVLATMAQSLAAVMICSMLWVAIGYSLAFTGEGPYDRHLRARLPVRAWRWTARARSPRRSRKRCS